MKRIRNIRRVVCAVMALMLASIGVCAMAENQNTVNYAVRAVLPENQINDQASSFDLKVKPGQEQVLQVIIKNKADEDIEVAVEANTAFTNGNGVIEFSHTEERDASMTVDFARIVTPVKPVVMVPARSEAVAEFLVCMPDEPFEGIVYGGFMFTKLHQGEALDDGSFGIRNIYRYAIGARLRESDAAAEPAFEVMGAELGRIISPVLLLHLRNPRPVIARGIALCVSVYAQGSPDAVVTFERRNVEMAPNSSMPYVLYFEDHKMPLEPGAYRVSVDLQFEDHSWQFETALTVD